jgi:tellurite resistance protein TerC
VAKFSFLFWDFMTKPLWMWLVFAAVVFFLLLFDLGVWHRKEHEIGLKESLRFSALYIGVGLLFGAWLWRELGEAQGAAYLTGFIVEKTLSVDNVFVMASLFAFFRVPRLYQHRVLFWGLVGALLLRGCMIAFGAALVSAFAWVLYLFAAFLIVTGVKMLLVKGKPTDLKKNILLRLMQKHCRLTEDVHGRKFFVSPPRRAGSQDVVWLTPLFVCLVMIEFADVLFAVDSIPAIFVITPDPFIVYTSNIFAILGLRALYFVLAAMVQRFLYLKYALALVLIFIGGKTFVAPIFGMAQFPVGWSLGITCALLLGGTGYSVWSTRNTRHHGRA